MLKSTDLNQESLPGLALEKRWREILQEEIEKPYVADLKKFLKEELKAGYTIYPPLAKVFQAFLYTPYDDVKVVVMGQDPYHGPSQAHGLSFSVENGIALPPSLKNIIKELMEDVHIERPKTGCLINWAKQGVLLLNATLTVREGEANSHKGIGWERFTDAVIEKLCERKDPMVFLLWGRSAQEKCERILSQKTHPHLVLKAAHPSPFSVTGFLGCRHFSKANSALRSFGKEEIDWRIV
jgi:uracil-DNA glycosylase